ncbi:MAG: hypothetical protein J6C96_08360 [Oscillospiraceae bacterium]|nr:hypothetical protein [Oscillospiraceae bacterium]
MGFFHELRPKNKAAFGWLAALLVAAAAPIFLRRASFKSDKGVGADLYTAGKKGNPKAVFITNITPKKAVKYAAQNYINHNF